MHALPGGGHGWNRFVEGGRGQERMFLILDRPSANAPGMHQLPGQFRIGFLEHGCGDRQFAPVFLRFTVAAGIAVPRERGVTDGFQPGHLQLNEMDE